MCAIVASSIVNGRTCAMSMVTKGVTFSYCLELIILSINPELMSFDITKLEKPHSNFTICFIFIFSNRITTSGQYLFTLDYYSGQ